VALPVLRAPSINTHIKTPKLLQICKQVITRLLWSRYQDVFALLVPSCCDKSETSCYHLVTRLMTVTDLLQVVPTRLIQAVRNKLLRACCHQLVNNLLRADDIRLVGTTCCESVDLIKLVPDLSTTAKAVRTHSLWWQAVRILRVWYAWLRVHPVPCNRNRAYFFSPEHKNGTNDFDTKIPLNVMIYG
jgi:hypothetical protein